MPGARRRARLVVIVAVVVLLAGCAHVTSGTVTEKRHEDAYTFSTMVCTVYSPKGFCTVWAPIIQHQDERWVFTLENRSGDTGDVDVDEATYESIDVGTVYSEPSDDRAGS